MFLNIYGCIIGTAIGDALGLPMEGISKKRQKKLFKDLYRYHLIFGKGMCSDDTDHICFTAEALIESVGDEKLFQKSLVKKFKTWVLTLPAGIGKATLISGIKLLLFFPVEKAGVFSAGNGPAMRSPIIGVCYGENIEKMKSLVSISSKISHSDPKANTGALIVAYAAYLSAQGKEIVPRVFINDCEKFFWYDDNEIFSHMSVIPELIYNNETTQAYVEKICPKKGITGYINHTVPAVIFCWLKNQNEPVKALEEIIRCGGDTDTTAAILGAILGAKYGIEGFPLSLRKNLAEWPRTTRWMEQLSLALETTMKEKVSASYTKVSYTVNLLRNLLFIIVVIAHIFRRLLPPY